ncbi:EI24 domain-containing protein [Campylobacter mucosalis]|uniref:Putative membrane protein (EI24 domain) n=1 Tax=Campylobacter mucosalis CCUG 21559 TaxID=1032067 RepID=A0A6G5QEY6_9BACT|nr:EI24 domain-containing protein [Campylobacter mucosalis]QCD44212.1 putative membrane protein (EI24 domain) [Campylobacter mucosalis CCUG 21559]
MIEILKLSWSDFLTKKFILLSILPLFCSLFVLGFGLVLAGNELGQMLGDALNSGDFGFINLSNYPFIMSIIGNGVVKWLLGAVFYTLGSYFMLMLSIIVALFIAGFLTPIVCKEINKRHYNANFTPISTSHTIKLITLSILKFLALLLISLPFMFIPILNFIAINIPFFYIYSKLLLIDVGSNTLSVEKFQLLWLENGGFKFLICAFLFYIISLLPLLGLILQLFFIIFLTHLFFKKSNLANLF